MHRSLSLANGAPVTALFSSTCFREEKVRKSQVIVLAPDKPTATGEVCVWFQRVFLVDI
jgi:hypothetical protein